MPTKKSRVVSSSEDEEYDSKPEVSKSTSSKRSKDIDLDSEPKSKKSRPSTSTSNETVEIEENEDGDPFFKLSENRRVTVRTFKGKVLIDMRETYKDKSTGQVKPGNKGISLTKEQWDLIKNNIINIDEMIIKVNEK
ncbi:uncharacterized protein I206_104324 [Kwoniella pini CBS 10737]|uniref:Transcriptional coactivator p15 (PC4) C-terminal domain-containing protein n=1 Tax=Kwoniella pini CBS 10737 TaxID=1296096 RepID=A0A1B9I1Z8_9TREE|nr:uncharacterized protein I206_04098 [Kwoniella pini CBS 10737]OCF49576.1 hypothetical protein I206_04098 [Kwoniella pini CBS 10737]